MTLYFARSMASFETEIIKENEEIWLQIDMGGWNNESEHYIFFFLSMG